MDPQQPQTFDGSGAVEDCGKRPDDRVLKEAALVLTTAAFGTHRQPGEEMNMEVTTDWRPNPLNA